MEVKCSLVQADVPTMSNRIYPKKELQKAIDKLNSQDHMVGNIYDYRKQLFLPDCLIDISSISHKVNKIWLDDDGFLMCDIEILNTPDGDILKKIWTQTEPFPCFIATLAEDGKTVNNIDDLVIHMRIAKS